jgi:hypothetical protein
MQALCRGRVNNEPRADRRVLPLGLGNLPECRSQACAARRAPVGWRRGVAAQGGGDVAVSMDAQDADGEVAKAGYGPRGRRRCRSGGILGKGVADVVQRLDAAAAASVIGQVAGWAWAV